MRSLKMDVHWSQVCLEKGYILEVSQFETARGMSTHKAQSIMLVTIPARGFADARIYSHIGKRLFGLGFVFMQPVWTSD